MPTSQPNNNIAILIISLAGGGAERVVAYLSEYLVEKGYTVHLFLLHKILHYEVPKGVQLHVLSENTDFGSGLKKIVTIPFIAHKYGKELKKLQIGQSLSFLTRPNFINVLSKTMVRANYNIVLNERSYPSMHYRHDSISSKLNKWLIRKLYPKGDKIIGNSLGNYTDLMEHFNVPREKLSVINNPIDLEKIKSIEPVTNFFDKDFINLITVGRLDVGKNHIMLIEALYKLKNPRIRLYIFGSGDLEDFLNERISSLSLNDQIYLMGFDANPFRYLKGADLFVFASLHEGFPNVLLEAMACNLPIISTNCKAGPSEIMEVTNEKEDDLMFSPYGILVPPENVSLMAKAIAAMIKEDNYKSYKEKIKLRVTDFAKEKILKRFLEQIQ